MSGQETAKERASATSCHHLCLNTLRCILRWGSRVQNEHAIMWLSILPDLGLELTIQHDCHKKDFIKRCVGITIEAGISSTTLPCGDWKGAMKGPLRSIKGFVNGERRCDFRWPVLQSFMVQWELTFCGKPPKLHNQSFDGCGRGVRSCFCFSSF